MAKPSLPGRTFIYVEGRGCERLRHGVTFAAPTLFVAIVEPEDAARWLAAAADGSDDVVVVRDPAGYYVAGLELLRFVVQVTDDGIGEGACPVVTAWDVDEHAAEAICECIATGHIHLGVEASTPAVILGRHGVTRGALALRSITAPTVMVLIFDDGDPDPLVFLDDSVIRCPDDLVTEHLLDELCRHLIETDPAFHDLVEHAKLRPVGALAYLTAGEAALGAWRRNPGAVRAALVDWYPGGRRADIGPTADAFLALVERQIGG